MATNKQAYGRTNGVLTDTETEKDIPEAVKDEPQLEHGVVSEITRISSTMSILVSGIALFSDGFNAQISVFCIHGTF